MLNFFKIVFGTFLALVLFTVCVALLGIAVIVGLVRMKTDKKDPTIEKGSYLVLDMSVNVTDTPPPSEGEQFVGRVFGGGDQESVSLRSLLGAINAAKGDSRIAGIFLTGSFEPQGYGSGFAALKEVREALQAFRDAPARKPVTALPRRPQQARLLPRLRGEPHLSESVRRDGPRRFASEPTFYKGALDKYGIGVQVTRVGKYKSYVEPYILQKMSPENREQTTKLLDDLWTEFKAGVEQDRKIPADQVQALADKSGIVTAETAKGAGLVNDLAYLPDVLEQLRKQTGDATDSLTDRHTFKQVDLATYAKQMVAKPETTENHPGQPERQNAQAGRGVRRGRHRGRRGRGDRRHRWRPFRARPAPAAQRREPSRASSCASTAPAAAGWPARSSSANSCSSARRASRSS